MMKLRYIITSLLISFFLLNVTGKPVTVTEVRQVIYALLDDWEKELEITGIEPRYLEDGELAYYMVDLGTDGWVMVSGDDVLRPVLAFSFENGKSPEESWNDAARYMLGQYTNEVSIAIREPGLQRNEGWDRAVLPSAATKSVSADPVTPFIEVNWNQSSGWNMFCPEDEAGPGGRAYVGCVAVAMAQAMSVYEFPARPKGVKTYLHDVYGSITANYDMSDPYEWDQMSSTSYDSANALLLYHCAVSVEMDFGPDASGAYVRHAGSPLKQYFSYSENIKFYDRNADSEAWDVLLIDELAAGRPIIYRGVNDDGGHAWNIDGYYDMNGVSFYHMNFGWSGSQNGYYTLNDINPGSSAFDEGQGALVGIAPPSSYPYDLSLSSLSVSEALPVGSFVADVTVEDEDPENTYTFTCKGPYSFLLRDYGPASFYIENGQLFTDVVFDYDDSNPENNSEFLLIIVEDQYGNEYQEEFNIAIEKAYHGPEGIALSDTSVLEKQPVGTAVGKLIIEDEDAENAYTYTLYGPYNQGTSTYDPASFYVENDTLKTLVVFDHLVADTVFLLVELLDNYGNQLSRAFTIQIEPDQSGANAISNVVVESRLLYPNPADRQVIINTAEAITSLEVYEIATGRQVMMLTRLNGTLDVSGLPEGIYLVLLNSAKGVSVQKLLIQH